MEHIPEPYRCVAEIKRVLKPGGRLVIQIPFLYPIHDAPLDFHRWTIYGLEQLGKRFDFTRIRTRFAGAPIETAALLANVSLVKTVLNWITNKNPLLLFLPVVVVLIPIINLIGALFSNTCRNDSFMAFSYTVTLEK